MNLILENSDHVKWYTYLHEPFKVIPEFSTYYWLISDLEVNDITDPKLQDETWVISGQELNEIIQREDVQFIWGVLSAFTEPIKKLPKKLPFADGNGRFWKGKPKVQSKKAVLEIVCWDGTYTLFIGVPDSIADKLAKLYPDIRDLDEYNKLRG